MTNMEIATYLGIAGLSYKEVADKDPEDIITPKILEATRIAQLYFTTQAMEELKKELNDLKED